MAQHKPVRCSGIAYLFEPLINMGSISLSKCSCEQGPTIRSRTTESDRSSRGGSSSSDKTMGLIVELAVGLSVSVLMGLTVRYLVSTIADLMNMDETRQDRPAASVVERRLRGILAKREQNVDEQKNVTLPPLNSYELQIAQVITDPDDIDSSFADIGGLDKTKKEIYELAILPLIEPDLFQGKLVQPCKGILLYGKPGTGKTMLAKALAKEAAAVFVPLQLSTILNKYLGESNKMIAATFTLARKLAPAIIFIDELDTFLKASTAETAYLDTIKSEFLTWWDGIGTSSNMQVLVLGATNRPENIDPAILRRMPRAFAVPLPEEAGRKAILTLLFQDEKLTNEATAFIPRLAKKTYGYSGSDLKELAKAAAMVAVQERTAEFAERRVMGKIASVSQKEMHAQRKLPLRPMTVADMELALTKVQKTGEAAKQYGATAADEEARERQRSALTLDNPSLQQLTSLLRALSNLSVNQPSGYPLENPDNKEEDDDDDIPNL